MFLFSLNAALVKLAIGAVAVPWFTYPFTDGWARRLDHRASAGEAP